MHGTYNPYLVVASVLVAVLVSYTVVELSIRIGRIEAISLKRRLWLLCGGIVIGSGIWSMHFLGMLACRMPMELSYDPWITLLSLLIAIAIGYLALHRTTKIDLTGRQLATDGALMGTGIASMHYIGMYAIRVQPVVHFHSIPFAASLLIAFGASWAALWMMFQLREESSGNELGKRAAPAIVMGIAIIGMHYTGMSAAIFPENGIYQTGGIDRSALIMMVAILSFGGLTMTVVITKLDGRFDELVQISGLANNLAEIDTVTGIPNRSALLALTSHRMQQTDAKETVLGVMLLNLDGFKTINDSLGFTAGDELLKAFSEDLLIRVRSNTVVARIGGDEFVVLIEGARERVAIAAVAKSIFDRLETNFHIDNMPLRVTASAGVAVYPQDGDSLAALLMSANMAMNAAKQQGKNACRLFEPAMGDAASKALRINRSFNEALEKNQFQLVYQPKFDGSTNKVSGAEALIRWQHPVMGNIPPGDFIPIAEKTGRIVQISEWVIREVCRQLKVWEQRGLPAVRISINLSPEQLGREGYSARIAAMVMEAGIDPSSILFEITETAAMREPKQASEMIRDFQRAGFNFAIDDFGTGYSSMAYLQHFRVKELKIDRFFISSLDKGGEEEHTIVAAIIALAHALHMTVVAEGVETAYQLKMLSGMNCDEIQGYLLGRPMTPANFERLLREEAAGASPVASLLQLKPASLPVLHSATA